MIWLSLDHHFFISGITQNPSASWKKQHSDLSLLATATLLHGKPQMKKRGYSFICSLHYNPFQTQMRKQHQYLLAMENCPFHKFPILPWEAAITSLPPCHVCLTAKIHCPNQEESNKKCLRWSTQTCREMLPQRLSLYLRKIYVQKTFAFPRNLHLFKGCKCCQLLESFLFCHKNTFWGKMSFIKSFSHCKLDWCHIKWKVWSFNQLSLFSASSKLLLVLTLTQATNY